MKIILVSQLLLNFCCESYCQFNYLSKNNGLFGLTVYLGDDKNEKFSSDDISKIHLGDTLKISFLGYQTYHLASLNQQTKEQIVSYGLILPSSTKRQTLLSMQYAFGKAGDTCYVNCREATINNWEGKSALLTAFALMEFFREGKDLSQPDPHGETKYIEKNGTLFTGTDSAQFMFSYRDQHPHGEWQGWLQEDGDSIRVGLPENMANRKGKKMGVKHLQFDPGVVLEKGDTVYAALDFGINPVKVYLLKSLSEKEKLKIASFLLTIVSEL